MRPSWASIIAVAVPVEFAMLDVVFFRLVPLFELVHCLGALSVLGFMIAFFSQNALRQFFLFLAFGSIFSLLLLSCFTGVGWENPIMTAVIDFTFSHLEPRDYELVQDSLANGTISPAHARAYRFYHAFGAGLRFCLLIALLMPTAAAIRYWKISQTRSYQNGVKES